jgi:formylglycine-generating enzyme required for sulfatase activity
VLLSTALLPVAAVAQDASDSKRQRKAQAATPPSKARKAALDCPEPPPYAAGETGTFHFRDCADTPEMVRLLGGSFVMGESGGTGTLYERPLRDVTISEFSIGRYEVTFDEWDACFRAGGCLKNPEDEGWGRGRRPVINVSWVDAQQYVHWLSQKTGRKYRLPTEAEWEYAARAGTTGRYFWGEGAEWACESANVFDLTSSIHYPNWHWRATCDDGFAQTAPVGSFQPNKWGLYDVSGNVWEWVQDCWHSDYTNAPVNGEAWISGGECGKRVNRGGGWGNHPRSMRSATRDADGAEGFSNAMGFRVAREP